jgi:hypothetical protein
MAKKYEPADLTKIKTYSVSRRAHKFDAHQAAGLPPQGATFSAWWQSLPPYLGAAALKALATSMVQAHRANRPIVAALGAHVVKVGCSPIICDLIERGVVTAIVMNGATAIHDVETALFGETSEEVADTIKDGSFGMVQETPAFFAAALSEKSSPQAGLGSALGAHLLKTHPPHSQLSILAAAQKAGIPAAVIVAIGTDTIHMHPSIVQSDLLSRSESDFRLVCSVVADLAPQKEGAHAGVWCNIGSAVVLPEVFLKTVAVARNLGANLDDITTANLDMIRHYRPSENVVGRPVKKGRGHHITGHHEILLPLLRQAIVEMI